MPGAVRPPPPLTPRPHTRDSHTRTASQPQRRMERLRCPPAFPMFPCPHPYLPHHHPRKQREGESKQKHSSPPCTHIWMGTGCQSSCHRTSGYRPG
jgi:hypothetical protein